MPNEVIARIKSFATREIYSTRKRNSFDAWPWVNRPARRAGYQTSAAKSGMFTVAGFMDRLLDGLIAVTCGASDFACRVGGGVARFTRGMAGFFRRAFRGGLDVVADFREIGVGCLARQRGENHRSQQKFSIFHWDIPSVVWACWFDNFMTARRA
jgi:hypothetical protein